jgi:hypothetical protein
MTGTKHLAILAVAVLVVAGCGDPATGSSAGASASSQTSSVSATPTPTATPTPNPSAVLAALATQYGAISDKGNAALVQCNKDKAAANGDLAKGKLAAKDCLAVYDQVLAEMKAVNWGPAQPKADAVVTAMGKIDAIVAQMVNASDGSAFLAAYAQLTPAATELLVSANALRAAIGLPPAKL